MSGGEARNFPVEKSRKHDIFFLSKIASYLKLSYLILQSLIMIDQCRDVFSLFFQDQKKIDTLKHHQNIKTFFGSIAP